MHHAYMCKKIVSNFTPKLCEYTVTVHILGNLAIFRNIKVNQKYQFCHYIFINYKPVLLFIF